MKNKTLKYLVIGGMLVTTGACTVFKNNSPEYAVDPVCGMKVQQSEAYRWKYEEKRYYFDTYTCKQSFKMNPKKFSENKCTTLK